jgi:hypothetical protein
LDTFFPSKKAMHLDKKWQGLVLGDFFTNSFGHPDNSSIQLEKKEGWLFKLFISFIFLCNLLNLDNGAVSYFYVCRGKT